MRACCWPNRACRAPAAPATNLFDKLGSLGLTSFMQEITRVRALEGELARTIQTMRGVKAARVHLVMPDEGSFRRAKQPPSASVVLRTEGADNALIAQAVRHLVAAALPVMTVDQVTVLNVDGQLLASGADGADSGPNKMLALEKSVTDEIQNNVRRTLAPYLSLRNFQISVAARLNTDKKETTQTTYDPESRVERSVRTVKETQTSQNTSTQSPTSVGRNVPQPNPSQGDGKQAAEDSQKKEELTNYELSSKVTIDGVQRFCHRQSVGRGSGQSRRASPRRSATRRRRSRSTSRSPRSSNWSPRPPACARIAATSSKSRRWISSTAARSWSRCRRVSIVEALMRQFGTIVSALAMLGVAALVVWVGLRPATRALIDMREALLGEGALALPGGGEARRWRAASRNCR